jgi:hypothetical protein
MSPFHVENDSGAAREEIRFLAPGTMVANRYEIDSPLGTGRYAVVYAAYDHELARRIAIKVFRADRVSPTAFARMRTELAKACRLSSPRVVRQLDVGHDGAHAFVTMELVEGTSLRKELSTGPFALDDVLRVTRAMLESLGAMHAKGLVHRGLRPANVLVSKDGRIRLSDHGMSRPWEIEGARPGDDSPDYASPEQRLGRRVDARSDLYALGLVMWEMLAGRLPSGEGAESRAPERVPDIRTVRSDVPAWLATLLRRLLDAVPDDRPRDAAAVLSAIRAKRIDWGYRWRKARKRVALVAGASVIIGAVGTGAWMYHESRFDRVETDRAGTLRAVDRGGRVLWSAESFRGGAVRVREGTTLVVGLAADGDGNWDADGESARALVARDAQTGGEKGAITSTPAPALGLATPRFVLDSVNAVDIEGDGLEEIVAVYAHVTERQSYAVLIDPRTNDAGLIFQASGRHRFLASLDVDVDGRKEILMGGPNAGLGERYGVAALRVSRARPGAGRTWALAATPDQPRADHVEEPLWYALLPGSASSVGTLDHVDRDARVFDIAFDDGRRERLTFDGFPAASPSPLPAYVRQRRREAAFRLLLDAAEAQSQGRTQTALATLVAADQAARDARDRELASWIETVRGGMFERFQRSEE